MQKNITLNNKLNHINLLKHFDKEKYTCIYANKLLCFNKKKHKHFLEREYNMFDM